jgi:hypothetical protein
MYPTNHALTRSCGQKIPVIGTCRFKCAYKDCSQSLLEFFIVQSAPTPILSYAASQQLNLVKLVLSLQSNPAYTSQLFDEFSELF